MTSFCKQFEKEDVGYCGKLSRVRESVLFTKSERGKRESISPGNGGEHWSTSAKEQVITKRTASSGAKYKYVVGDFSGSS